MGVRGLTTFVDQNPQLLMDLQLHDTCLLIDGNNLYFFLYSYFRLNYQYGGDYDAYSKCAHYFFAALRSCGVEPYVIFDGGCEADDRKLPTVLKRAKERLRLAGLLAAGYRAKILPLLTYETFRTVLDELNISHVTCDGEADDEIAGLANKWNCPVLSNDSDFFIYDLKGGFILLDYLDLEVKQKAPEDGCGGYKYLEVQVYYFETFIQKCKGSERAILPLFATMLGNDFVDIHEFDAFYARAKLPRPQSKRFHTGHNRHSRILSVLLWLETRQTVEAAVRDILSFINADKRDSLQKTIIKSMESYTKLPLNLEEYFSGTASTMACKTSVSSYGRTPLPDWFIHNVRRGLMATQNFMAISKHRVIQVAQIEMMNEPSAYECAKTIRQAIYAILLSLDKTVTPLTNKDISVEEVDRVGKQIKRPLVQPLDLLDNSFDTGLDGIHMEGIPQLDTATRRRVWLSMLGVPSLDWDDLSTDLQFLLAVLVFWVMHANPRIAMEHLVAVVASILKLSVIDVASECKKVGRGNRKIFARNTRQNFQKFEHQELECGTDTTFENSVRRSTETELKVASVNMEKFTSEPKHTNARRFDGTILHAFSQLQTCLHAAIHLNQLLLSPFPQPDPAKVFNGTFAYNLTRELKTRSHMQLFICEQLGRASPLGKLCEKILHIIMSVVPDCRLIGSMSKDGKKAKKKKHSVSDKDIERAEVQDAAGMIADNEKVKKKKPKLTTVAKCELANRFAGLLISDEEDSKDDEDDDSDDDDGGGGDYCKEGETNSKECAVSEIRSGVENEAIEESRGTCREEEVLL